MCVVVFRKYQNSDLINFKMLAANNLSSIKRGDLNKIWPFGTVSLNNGNNGKEQ